MSYSLLQKVARGPLPMVFADAVDIDSVRVLRDGGWVRATFSAPPGRAGTATVTELTPLGRVAMRFVPPDKGDA